MAASETAHAASLSAAKALASKVQIAETITIQEHRTASSVDDFDRTPNPAHLKVRLGQRDTKIPIATMESKLHEILADLCLNKDSFEVFGPKLGGLFTINCCKVGTIGSGELRARSIMDYLYNHGSWRDITVDNPGGTPLRLFFERDKNRKQSTGEALTRKAAAIIKEDYPALAAQISGIPRDQKAYHAGKCILRVVVDGPSNAHIEWAPSARELGIDIERTTAKWKLQGRNDDGIEWIRV